MREQNIATELRELNIALMRHVAKHKAKTSHHDDSKPFPDIMHGLQIWVIDYLIQHQDEDVFQKDLEKEFVMRRPTATNFIKKLEHYGLVRREPVAYDARLKKIILTDKAIGLRDTMSQRKKEFERMMHAGLSSDEISQFIATIQKIKRNLGVEDV